MNQPLVSICIPTYKQTNHLKGCLESILMQDFKDYELIITDDTPDDSIQVFLQGILKNHNYMYHRNFPALGSPENWNLGLRLATGKYVKILHHDDLFTQSYSLRLMVEMIEREQSSFLFCETDVWYTKSNTRRIHSASTKQLAILKSHPEFLFFKNIIGAPSATLHLNQKHEYDKRFKWLVDVDYYIQEIKQNKISFISQPLISTAHDIEGQITGDVINDKKIQITEHVLLFNKIFPHVNNIRPFRVFFDDLFFVFNIKSIDELIFITPEANNNLSFYNDVISGVTKNRFIKKIIKRFYNSRYNNYIFKIEQFV